MTSQISPTDAAKAIEDGAVLLDVREPFEVATADVAGALHIPMGEVIARAEEIPQDVTIVCMCHHGGRSDQVAGYLAGQGYDVVNMTGGIDQWSLTVDSEIPRYA